MKKNIIILLVIFTFNVGLFANLITLQEDLKKQINYVNEDAIDPVLRGLYKSAIDSYNMSDFESAVFYLKKVIDIRKNYQDTEFLIEAMEKMLNYPNKEAKNIVISEYVEQGREYYDNRQYIIALNIWEKLLILDPMDVDTLKKYINDSRRLLADPYYERGWEYYKAREYYKAIDEWEYVLGLVPTYKGLEALVEKTRERANAIEIAKLIEEAQKNYDADNMQKALELIDKALTLDIRHDEAGILKKIIINKMKREFSKFFDSGRSLFNSGEYKQALNSFNRALKYFLNPKQERDTKDFIARCRHELSSLKIEKYEIKEEVVKTPDTSTTDKYVDKDSVRKYYSQGLYYYRNGYIEKAISEWEMALSLDPENERAYTSLQRAKADLAKKRGGASA